MDLGRRHAVLASLGMAAGWAAGSGDLDGPGRETTTGSDALWLGGDVHLGAGRLRMTSVARWLDGARGVVNLEGPVTSAPTQGGPAPRLANHPEGLSSLVEAGVAVVTTANNHAADFGDDGASGTREALSSAGLAVSDGGDVARLPHPSGAVVVSAHDLAGGVPPTLAAELARASRWGVLVATFHVTGAPSYLPRPELVRAAELALDAGARVVAAHGTHAIGPVERRGEQIIAWGLGNLAFSCDCTHEVDGALLRVSFDGPRTRAHLLPIDAGLFGAPVRPSHDPELILDLFRALGSSPLERQGDGATF